MKTGEVTYGLKIHNLDHPILLKIIENFQGELYHRWILIEVFENLFAEEGIKLSLEDIRSVINSVEGDRIDPNFCGISSGLTHLSNRIQNWQ